MGGKSAKAPDYAPLAAASKEAAETMAGLGREQLAFAKQQYTELQPTIQQIAESQIAAQNEQMAQARDYYDYQKEVFRPVERGLVQQAMDFNTADYRNALASQAAADAARAFSATQSATQRAQAARGVNPNSGAAQAMATQTNLGLAANRAATMTGTRRQAEQIGFARQMDVTGLGRGLSGASLGAYSGATGAGTAASGNLMAPGNQYMAGMVQAGNTMGQGFQIGNQGLSNILNTQAGVYNNAMNAKGEMWGAVLGAGARLGAAAIPLSDRRVKKNIVQVGINNQTGLPVYEFEYTFLPGRRFKGVMADDVERRYPDAVVDTPSGIKAVNYSMLGMEMVEV